MRASTEEITQLRLVHWAGQRRVAGRYLRALTSYATYRAWCQAAGERPRDSADLAHILRYLTETVAVPIGAQGGTGRPPGGLPPALREDYGPKVVRSIRRGVRRSTSQEISVSGEAS